MHAFGRKRRVMHVWLVQQVKNRKLQRHWSKQDWETKAARTSPPASWRLQARSNATDSYWFFYWINQSCSFKTVQRESLPVVTCSRHVTGVHPATGWSLLCQASQKKKLQKNQTKPKQKNLTSKRVGKTKQASI